jgi:hypothetical protein
MALEPVAVEGCELTQSDATPADVTFDLTPKPTAAARTTIAGRAVLLDKIQVTCDCGGTVSGNKYKGSGSADIPSTASRLACEGAAVLQKNDHVTVNCTGTVTLPNGGTTPATASVTVTVSDAGQDKVLADGA